MKLLNYLIPTSMSAMLTNVQLALQRIETRLDEFETQLQAVKADILIEVSKAKDGMVQEMPRPPSDKNDHP